MNRTCSLLLVEGAHRLSAFRLAHGSKNHGCISPLSVGPVAGCGRRRPMHARIQEPQWNFHNRHRLRSPSYAQFFFSNGRSWNLMCESRRSAPILALGGANFDACPTRSLMNGRKYRRCFGSSAKDSSNAKPDLASQIIDDADTPKKAKTTVPKEYIDALKSEVDEMESSSPPTIQRTQEDFADYLIGSNMDHESLLKSSSSASETAPNAHGTSPDSGKVVNKGNEKKIATDPTGAFPVHQYKFSSSDALVSVVVATVPRCQICIQISLIYELCNTNRFCANMDFSSPILSVLSTDAVLSSRNCKNNKRNREPPPRKMYNALWVGTYSSPWQNWQWLFRVGRPLCYPSFSTRWLIPEIRHCCLWV